MKRITAALKTRNSPCSIGRSGPFSASNVARPRPGHEKIVSTAIAPGEDEAEVDRDQRHHRQQRVRHRVPVADDLVAQPLRARQREVVLAHRLEQRRAHHERVLAQVRERQRQRGQEHVLRLVEELRDPVASEFGSVMPPTGNQPSTTANVTSSSIPSQKSGIEYVAIVNAWPP